MPLFKNRCCPVNIATFLRTVFLEHLWWLLLQGKNRGNDSQMTFVEGGTEFNINPLSVNFTKWSNTLKQFVGNLPTNCLSVFGYFVGSALKVLTT